MSTAPSVPSALSSGSKGGDNRPGVIQLNIKEKAALYVAYIPMFQRGGLFIPTKREYKLGEDVFVLLALPDEKKRYTVAGRVAWINPPNVGGSRAQGIGIQFPEDENAVELKVKIEQILGAAIASGKSTQTI